MSNRSSGRPAEGAVWSGRRRAALLAGYAATTFLAFPQVVAGRVIDLGLVLAWVAPACLVLAVEDLAPRRAAGLGFLASLVAQSSILHWIWVVTVVYGHAPPWAGVVAPIALGAYIAVFSAAFAVGAAWLTRVGAASVLVLAAWWTALDHLRSFALSGFPWATLGYTQHENPALMALASWTGVYGLSFITVLGGVAFARVFRASFARRRPSREALAALTAVVALHVLGAGLSAFEDSPDTPRLRVAVLQGNIDQRVKWSPEGGERTLSIYEDLTRRAAAQGARLILWPETAVQGSVATDEVLRQRLGELAVNV